MFYQAEKKNRLRVFRFKVQHWEDWQEIRLSKSLFINSYINMFCSATLGASVKYRNTFVTHISLLIVNRKLLVLFHFFLYINSFKIHFFRQYICQPMFCQSINSYLFMYQLPHWYIHMYLFLFVHILYIWTLEGI